MTQVKCKTTGKIITAIYTTTPGGNKRYNVNGKFYTDRQFDKLFTILPGLQRLDK